jgi:16S rRNA processing protein RimM
MTENWVILARLLRPQGRRGELLAEVLTDFRERFESLSTVTLLPPDSAKATPRNADLIAHWFPVGRNAGRVVLHFAGVDSISAAEELAQWSVALPMDERMPLDEDTEYIGDLIGCALYNGETLVGTVEDIEFPSEEDGVDTGADAPALLSVVHGEEEHLIPFIKAWLVEMDTTARRITMKLPDGLLDINKG